MFFFCLILLLFVAKWLLDKELVKSESSFSSLHGLMGLGDPVAFVLLTFGSHAAPPPPPLPLPHPIHYLFHAVSHPKSLMQISVPHTIDTTNTRCDPVASSFTLDEATNASPLLIVDAICC